MKNILHISDAHASDRADSGNGEVFFPLLNFEWVIALSEVARGQGSRAGCGAFSQPGEANP